MFQFEIIDFHNSYRFSIIDFTLVTVEFDIHFYLFIFTRQKKKSKRKKKKNKRGMLTWGPDNRIGTRLVRTSSGQPHFLKWSSLPGKSSGKLKTRISYLLIPVGSNIRFI